MKLATIALASAFALASTYALVSTNHHKSGARTHHGSYARNYGPNSNYGGGPNNQGGLVGGDDSGTSARYGRVPAQPAMSYGGNNYGWNNNGWNYGGAPNNRPGLVGGDDSGTSARYGRVPYGGPTNANAFGGPVGGWGGVNSNDHAQRMKNLHDAGYDPKNDFNANGTIKTQ
jgi:hypothetical protein